MMKLRRIVYPLFLVVVLALVTIPVHAANPVFDTSTSVASCGTPCTTSSVAVHTGDTILVHTVCTFSATGDVNTPTDSLSNSYALLRHIGTATLTEDVWIATSIAGNAITVTVTQTGGVCSTYTVAVAIYSNVVAVGNTNVVLGSTSSASGSDTNPLTISSNSIIYETFNFVNGGCPTLAPGSAQSTRESYCFTGQAEQLIMDRSYSTGGAINSIANWSGAAGSSGTQHIVIELKAAGGTPSGLGTLTACYGNCGSPAVTLANTNSTHTINFNNSITLFYEFQSNLNGFILNETVNVAKTYSNGEQVGLGIYTAICSSTTTPFTSACPGQQRAVTISNPNPSKGRFTLTPSPISVVTGQWVAIAVTAIYSGLDLNDTNTSVPIFSQSPGTIPPLLNNGASFSNCSCKLGMWTYITGNTATIPPPIGGAQGCSADFLCFMTASACALTPSNCLIGALAFGIMYSLISVVILEIVSVKIGSGMTIPGGVYILTFFGWMTFWALIVGAIWFILVEVLTVVIIFSGFFGSLASGQHRSSGRDA